LERRISDLIIQLATGISQRRMYFDTHPRVVATSRDTAAGLADLIHLMGVDCFEVGVYNSKFVLDGRYLVGPSIAGRSLIDFAERLGCGGFVFHLPFEPADMTAFFRLGAEQFATPPDLAAAQALLDGHGLARIKLLARLTEEGDSPAAPGSGEEATAPGNWNDAVTSEFAPLLQVYQNMYESVAGNLLNLNRSETIDLDRTREAGLQLVGLSDQGALDVMQFLRYPDYDSYTIGHSIRVAALTVRMGRRLGWPKHVLESLATAGLLHDLGKGRIPEEILFKPEKLDPDERKIVESHPALGVQILLECGEYDATVISATWGHHIRHDGGGYPAISAQGERPGVVAELVHVCDVFEALTAHRPYKPSLSPRKAYEIMLGDEGCFHPTLLAEFITEMSLYPPGSQVNLDDGSIAVVVGVNAAFDRPRVKLTHDRYGQPLSLDEQREIDLAAVPERSVATLLSVGVDTSEPGGANGI
jgi:putative nucleotidyltransferase with HDIG domain